MEMLGSNWESYILITAEDWSYQNYYCLGNMAYIKGLFKLKIWLHVMKFHVFIYFKGEVCIVTPGKLENIFHLHYLILF